MALGCEAKYHFAPILGGKLALFKWSENGLNLIIQPISKGPVSGSKFWPQIDVL